MCPSAGFPICLFGNFSELPLVSSYVVLRTPCLPRPFELIHERVCGLGIALKSKFVRLEHLRHSLLTPLRVYSKHRRSSFFGLNRHQPYIKVLHLIFVAETALIKKIYLKHTAFFMTINNLGLITAHCMNHSGQSARELRGFSSNKH